MTTEGGDKCFPPPRSLCCRCRRESVSAISGRCCSCATGKKERIPRSVNVCHCAGNLLSFLSSFLGKCEQVRKSEWGETETAFFLAPCMLGIAYKQDSPFSACMPAVV